MLGHLEEIALAALHAYADDESDVASNAVDTSTNIVDGHEEPPETMGDTKVVAEVLADVQDEPTQSSAKATDEKEVSRAEKPPPRDSAAASGAHNAARQVNNDSDGKFLCPFEGCSRAYNAAEHLQRHQLTHATKGYRCERSFYRRDVLNRHRHKHEAEPPGKFRRRRAGCEQSFVRQDLLNQHMLTHFPSAGLPLWKGRRAASHP
jgi:hypothetical protein